jgi:hypothetical protein
LREFRNKLYVVLLNEWLKIKITLVENVWFRKNYIALSPNIRSAFKGDRKIGEKYYCKLFRF